MTCLLSSGQGLGEDSARSKVCPQGPEHPSLWPCGHHPQALRVDTKGRDTLTPKSRGVPAVVSRLTGQVLPRAGVPG